MIAGILGVLILGATSPSQMLKGEEVYLKPGHISGIY